jgi:membrane peptidoglycan carboxypeptidase
LSKRRADGPAVKRRPTKGPKQPGSTKRRVLKVVKWLLIVGLVVTLTGIGAFYYAYTQTTIPEPDSEFLTQTTKVYYADGKTELGQFETQNRESIPLSEMPDQLQQAVIAAEDRSFYTNKGIDPKGILRAAFSNARGNATQGASTITQQYVKILYLTQERSLKRKLKEAFLSLKIQREQSKQQILEGYLNTIYFGRGAYGVQAAAQAYFDIPAKDLSLKQSAVLASVLNDPTDLDPKNGKDSKEALKERYDYVLDGMAQTGDITADEADKASRALPKFPKIQAESQYGGQKGFMLQLVRNELHSMGYSDSDIDGGGLRVTTTFTPAAMKAAADGVLAQKPEGFGDKELHIAAATVEPGTGALLGFYAGQDYLDSQINWAVAGGMVGSTFKPITLATAITAGFSLKDTFQGTSPYEFPDGLEVNNEGENGGNDYGSSVTALFGLEQSINTAYVDMSASIPDGPAKIHAMANALGMPPAKANKKYPGIPRTSRDLSADDTLITLGRARVSPINMANTYATFANGGVRADVHVIKKVVDRTGEDPKVYSVVNKDALDPDIDADVSYAMQQVVEEGTGQAALALDRPAAGKTGTATNAKDQVSSAWFVGYTPQLSTAVMYVRGDGDDQLDGWLPSYFGADYPARTWTAIMQQESEGMEVEEFPPPANVDGEAPDDDHEPEPTFTPTKRPSPTKKPSPTDTPTEEPTETPTETPTDLPTKTPTAIPTTEPTIAPPSSSAPPPSPTAVPTITVNPSPTPQQTTSPTAAATTAGGQPTSTATPRNSSWFLVFFL